MNKSSALALITSGLLVLQVPVALAQTPYWDSNNNGGSQGQQGGGFYNPSPSQDGSMGGYNGNYNNGGYNINGYGGNGGYGAPGGYNGGGYNGNGNLRGYVSAVPQGTKLMATVTSPISSATAHVGDPVTVTLNSDLASGGNVVLPAGTQVQGQVVSAIPAGRTGKNGQLQLRFSNATTPDGRTIPLSARLITQDGTGIIKGGTAHSRLAGTAKNTLGGAAIGAVGGTVASLFMGGHHWGQGALLGGGLGAGGGLVKEGFDKGQEATIEAGTPLHLMLDQPMNVQ